MEHILPSILTLLLGIAAGVGITFIIGYLRGNTLAKKANKIIQAILITKLKFNFLIDYPLESNI